MDDRPIGVADLNLFPFESGVDKEVYLDHWYWCRQHERAEHVMEPPIGCSDASHKEPADYSPKRYADRDGVVRCRRCDKPASACIRIGPFMSEREAERLGGNNHRPDAWWSPLGMEVER